jgi:phage gp36-like protein
MPSVYTTSSAVEARVGSVRLAYLLDRDGDGLADDGVLDAAIARAGAIIDRKLRQRYGRAVPFAQITATPPTPDAISKIAEDLVLFDLYAYFEPNGRDREYHEALAMEALEALAKGDDDIPVQRAAANEGRVIALVSADAPTFAAGRSRGI